MKPITPCLWFDTQAQEAADFYVSLFPNSRINDVTYYSEGMPGEPGSILTVEFELNGQTFTGLNGGPVFSFTPAISFAVEIAGQEELDRLWDALLEGGEPSQCGWLTDQYGVSWQLIPEGMQALLNDPDPARARRAGEAMMSMVKLDIAAIRAAADRVA